MTAQVHEILVLNGQEYPMAFCPPIPEHLDTIIKIPDDEVVKQIFNDRFDNIIFSTTRCRGYSIDIGDIILSTACWRSYIGTWEIKDGKFYLIDVVGRYRKVSKEPIFLEWFSDVLIVPKGKIIRYIHMGFKTVYEKEAHIVIKKGRVVQQVEINNVQKRLD